MNIAVLRKGPCQLGVYLGRCSLADVRPMKIDAKDLLQRDWPWPFRPLRPTDAYELLGIDYQDPIEVNVLAEKLVEELRSELSHGHPLHGADCLAIARNVDDNNEVVFVTNVRSYRVAYVHLTYQKENSSDYPYTVGYDSFEAFAEEVGSWRV